MKSWKTNLRDINSVFFSYFLLFDFFYLVFLLLLVILNFRRGGGREGRLLPTDFDELPFNFRSFRCIKRNDNAWLIIVNSLKISKDGPRINVL